MTTRTPQPLHVGLDLSMPAEQYHAQDAIGSGGVRALLKSAAHFRAYADAPPKDPTPAQAFGTLVHTLVLEPHAFGDRYIVLPDDIPDRRTKAGKEAWAALESHGKTIITQDDRARAVACATSIVSHPAAALLLNDTVREVSVGWHDPDTGVPCKARFDAWRMAGDRGIVDLKTAADASPDGFGRAAATHGYNVQAAHYMRGHEVATGEAPAFFAWIVVESEPPHAVACYQLPFDAYNIGLDLCRSAYRRHMDATQQGVWHAYSDLIQPLAFPAWALRTTEVLR